MTPHGAKGCWCWCCWEPPGTLVEPRGSAFHQAMFYKGVKERSKQKVMKCQTCFLLNPSINSAEAGQAEGFIQHEITLSRANKPLCWLQPCIRALKPVRYVKCRCWMCWFPRDDKINRAVTSLLLFFPCCRNLISSPNQNICVGKKMATINLNLITGIFSLGN